MCRENNGPGILVGSSRVEADLAMSADDARKLAAGKNPAPTDNRHLYLVSLLPSACWQPLCTGDSRLCS